MAYRKRFKRRFKRRFFKGKKTRKMSRGGIRF